MGRGFIAVALTLAIMFATTPLATVRAQQPGPSLAITTVDANAYPQMAVVLTALDAEGVPVAGLTANDFDAFEGDRPLEIAGVSSTRLDLGVAIVIDVSGSMQGAPMEAARAAAIEFVQNLAPNDTASLLAFSTDVRQVVPPTQDKAAVIAGIQSLQPAGDTALYDAAQAGIFAANQMPTPRRAVVFLSDGQNTVTTAVTADGALNLAQTSGVPVYTIGFGEADVTFLQALADRSNGRYFPATPTSIAAAYGEIARVLDSQYTLIVTGSEAPNGAPSTVRVTALIGGQLAEASAPFTRPSAPDVTTPTINPTQIGVANDDEGAPLAVLGGIAAAVAFGALVLGAFTVVQRTRTRRRQLAVVAPNPIRAEAQGVPMPEPGRIIDPDDGRGRLESLDGLAGGPWEFASRPIRIGSASDCEVRLPVSAAVAPQHALVWMRDGKIMLRHTATGRRTTLVAGRPVDWVILESGDEFAAGPHRFTASVLR